MGLERKFLLERAGRKKKKLNKQPVRGKNVRNVPRRRKHVGATFSGLLALLESTLEREIVQGREDVSGKRRRRKGGRRVKDTPRLCYSRGLENVLGREILHGKTRMIPAEYTEVLVLR